MIHVLYDSVNSHTYGFDDAVLASYGYSKEEIDRLVSSVLKLKGVKPNKAAIDAIPLASRQRGDVWIANDTKTEWAWVVPDDGEAYWESLGPIHDMSSYYTKEQVDQLIAALSARVTTLETKLQNTITFNAANNPITLALNVGENKYNITVALVDNGQGEQEPALSVEKV